MSDLRHSDRLTDFLDLFWQFDHAKRFEKYLWREELLLGKATKESVIPAKAGISIHIYSVA